MTTNTRLLRRWVQFVSGEKGGTGKSAFAALLYELYKTQRDWKVKAIDGDLTNPSLSVMYDDVTPVVLSDDRDELSQLNIVFMAALEKDVDVIVDLPARSESILSHWIDDYNVLDIAANYNIGFIKWWVSDGDPLSIPVFIQSTRDFPAIKHVFVKNMGLAKPMHWEQWESDPDMAEWRKDGEFIEFPWMNKELIAKSREFKKSFGELAHSSVIDVLQQGRFQGFLGQGFRAIQAAQVFQEIVEAQQWAATAKADDKPAVDSAAGV